MADEYIEKDDVDPGIVPGDRDAMEPRDYDGGDRGRGGYRGGPGGPGGPGGDRVRGGKVFFKKKVCRFCTQKLKVDYKVPEALKRFTTDRGKILPRRITGTCAKHQRALAVEIKKARCLALLPFVEK
jgi:small subunit ribosomal protein S18